MIDRINLKILVLDTDFYALRALNSSLAWDRRTRVVALAESIEEAFAYIRRAAVAEYPDVLLLEVECCPDPGALFQLIAQFREAVENLTVLCLARRADPRWVTAAVRAGARAYLIRNELRLRLVGAVLYAIHHRLVITPGVRSAAQPPYDEWLDQAALLPGEREYPEMTERIRQALWLCVIEGMPAQLAADEMGISLHTIRSYIKTGYRILEAYDDSRYPQDMGPLERAFMRFTALAEDIQHDAAQTDEDQRYDNPDADET